MKKFFILALACLLLSSMMADAQTRRRASAKRPKATFAEKQQAEIRAGRERIARQIKNLTQFLYLLGGIAKTIEAAEQSNRNREPSALTPEQIKQSRARVKESVASVRAGLDELERGFRVNPALTNFYSHLSGVAAIGRTAEDQSANNDFDESARSLLRVVNKLTDALVAMR